MTWHHIEVEVNEIQGNLLSPSCPCDTDTSTTDEPVDMEIDTTTNKSVIKPVEELFYCVVHIPKQKEK